MYMTLYEMTALYTISTCITSPQTGDADKDSLGGKASAVEPAKTDSTPGHTSPDVRVDPPEESSSSKGAVVATATSSDGAELSIQDRRKQLLQQKKLEKQRQQRELGLIGPDQTATGQEGERGKFKVHVDCMYIYEQIRL